MATNKAATLVHETSSTTGTGNLTIASVNARRRISDEYSTGGSNVFYAGISNRDADEWEYGSYSLLDANTLVRDTIIDSSNYLSGVPVAVDFSAGTKDVVVGLPGEYMVANPNALTFTFADAGQDAIFGWDDSAGEYSNLTTSEAMAVLNNQHWEPRTNDGWSLGVSGTAWSDLFLADGGVIDWGAGLVAINNQTDYQAQGFGELLRVDFGAGADAGIILTTTDTTGPTIIGHTSFNGASSNFSFYAGLETSTGVTTTGAGGYFDVISNTNGAIDTRFSLFWYDSGTAKTVKWQDAGYYPVTNDTVSLGIAGQAWSDIYLASGGVIETPGAGGLIIQNTGNATANDNVGGLIIRAQTSGTATTDFGTDIKMQGENASGTQQNLLRQLATYRDAINATEDTEVNFKVLKGGAVLDALSLGAPQPSFPGGADGHNFNLGDNAYDGLELVGTSTGTGGPYLYIYHDSTSPADNDYIGGVTLRAKDSAGNATIYGGMQVIASDVTNGTEDGQIQISSQGNGAGISAVRYEQGLISRIDAYASRGWKLNSTQSNYPMLIVSSDGAGTGGPQIALEHDSASPADADYAGTYSVWGRDSAANAQKLWDIWGYWGDVTSATENGYLILNQLQDGSYRETLNIKATQPGYTLADWKCEGYYQDFKFTFENNNTAGGDIKFYHDSASPADGDIMGMVAFNANDSGGTETNFCASILGVIADVTSATEDGKITFSTYEAGSEVARWSLSSGGINSTNATGGNKGAGTINADAVYDDNALLTCYVDDATKLGTVDIDYWDSKVADPDWVEGEIPKRHWPARQFAARLGTPHDPTTIAGQKQHLADKRHLTPYPNPDTYDAIDSKKSLGSWVQSGIEMDELLFQYVQELEARLSALEAA